MAVITLGQRIKELRMEADLSVRKLAAKVEKSPAFISDIELGRRFPSDEVLNSIADVLGADSDELKALDTRSSIDDLKSLAQTDPEWGMAFRTVANEAKNLTPDEFVRRLTQNKDGD